MENEKVKSPRNYNLFIKTMKLLISGKKHFFFYQMVFGLMFFSVLMPLVQLLAKKSREFSGYSYVTQENLADFISKPVTIVSIVILFLVIGFFLLAEISLVLSFLLSRKNLEKKSGFHLFLESLRKTFRCFEGKNIFAVFLAYIFMILSSIEVVYVISIRGRIPRYLIQSVKNRTVAMALLVLLVILLIYYAFINIFTLPYLLLENNNIKNSRKNTRQLMKGHVLYTIRSVILWNAGIFIISALLYIIIIVLEALFVILFVDRATSVAVFLTFYDHVNIYAALGFSWFGLYCNLGLMTELFLRYKKINDEEFQNGNMHAASGFFSNNRKRVIAVCFAIMFLLYDGAYTYVTVKKGNASLLSGIQITITAHRGSSSDAPENTVPAIEAAIKNMADVAEIDVQETKDGEVVVLHDSNLKRTSGYNEFIWNVTFEEARKLDFGSWFSSDFAGTKIPTLEEVIQAAQGKIKLNIEIKANSHYIDLEDKVVALIEKYDFVNQCVVQSTNYHSLERVKELNPDVKTGYILMAAYGDFKEKDAIDFFSIRSSFVNRNMVESAHKNGKEVYAWTVDTKNEIRRMEVLKVDNIITDRPILAREIIYKENFNSSFYNLLKLLKQ